MHAYSMVCRLVFRFEKLLVHLIKVAIEVVGEDLE